MGHLPWMLHLGKGLHDCLSSSYPASEEALPTLCVPTPFPMKATLQGVEPESGFMTSHDVMTSVRWILRQCVTPLHICAGRQQKVWVSLHCRLAQATLAPASPDQIMCFRPKCPPSPGHHVFQRMSSLHLA